MKLYNKRNKNKLKSICLLKNSLPLYTLKTNFDLFLIFTFFFLKLLSFSIINNTTALQFFTTIKFKNKDLRDFLVLAIMFYLIVNKKLTRKHKKYNGLLFYVEYKILNKYCKYYNKYLKNFTNYAYYVNNNLIAYPINIETDFWFDGNIFKFSPYFLIKNSVKFKYDQSKKDKIEYKHQNYVHNFDVIRVTRKLKKLDFELGNNEGNYAYKTVSTYFDAETAFNYLESGGFSQDTFIGKNIELSKKIFPLNRANLRNEQQYGVAVPLIF